jgi:Carbamate kinase
VTEANHTAVVALGGNALSPPGERSTIADQFRHTRESLGPIVDLAAEGWNLCIVHGNGPQVGDELVRNEISRTEVAPLPLGVLVAGTAGWIGYMIQQSIENALAKSGIQRSVAPLSHKSKLTNTTRDSQTLQSLSVMRFRRCAQERWKRKGIM